MGKIARPKARIAGDNAWRLRAACRDIHPEFFFGPEGEQAGARVLREDRAVDFCISTCTVIDDCLEWALASREQHGVWGATTPDERKSIKRRRARKADAAQAADEKECGRCAQTKPASGFYKDSKNVDGLRADCRDCYAEIRQSSAVA